jgi:hypothetical protein
LIVYGLNYYAGVSVLFEINFVYSSSKRIIFIEKPEEFILNNLPAEFEL